MNKGQRAPAELKDDIRDELGAHKDRRHKPEATLFRKIYNRSFGCYFRGYIKKWYRVCAAVDRRWRFNVF